MNVLVVEDEELIAQFITIVLEKQGYQVHVCKDGKSGLKKAMSPLYDALILDIGLPHVSGIDICRTLRKEKITTPVLFLSSNTGVDARVGGLDVGGDDYLEKPFEYTELLARLRAITRRPATVLSDELHAANIRLNQSSHNVYVDNKKIHLSSKQYEVLAILMRNPGVAISRHELLHKVWHATPEHASNRVDVCVRQLRQKISQSSEVQPIKTIWKTGYMFEDTQAT